MPLNRDNLAGVDSVPQIVTRTFLEVTTSAWANFGRQDGPDDFRLKPFLNLTYSTEGSGEDRTDNLSMGKDFSKGVPFDMVKKEKVLVYPHDSIDTGLKVTGWYSSDDSPWDQGYWKANTAAARLISALLKIDAFFDDSRLNAYWATLEPKGDQPGSQVIDFAQLLQGASFEFHHTPIDRERLEGLQAFYKKAVSAKTNADGKLLRDLPIEDWSVFDTHEYVPMVFCGWGDAMVAGATDLMSLAVAAVEKILAVEGGPFSFNEHIGTTYSTELGDSASSVLGAPDGVQFLGSDEFKSKLVIVDDKVTGINA
jgi:hypothetical protein